MALNEMVPLERRHQRGILLKSGYFTSTDLSSVKTVANKHRLAALYHNKHWWRASKGINIDYFEQPQTTQKKFCAFCDFRQQRTFQQWIAPKWLEVNWDNIMKLSALNVDLDSLSPNHPRFKKAWARGRQIISLLVNEQPYTRISSKFVPNFLIIQLPKLVGHKNMISSVASFRRRQCLNSHEFVVRAAGFLTVQIRLEWQADCIALLALACIPSGFVVSLGYNRI